MKEKEENDIKIDVYKSEKSTEYETVGFDKLLELIKSNKISYKVYQKRWYIITIIFFIIIVSMI